MTGFTLQKEDGLWWIYYGSSLVHEGGFKTISLAKRRSWRAFGVLPTVYLADSVPFDDKIPVHAALCAIERRNSPSQIISVTPTHYLLRRSRFTAELLVRYVVKDGMVLARKDSELLQSITT